MGGYGENDGVQSDQQFRLPRTRGPFAGLGGHVQSSRRRISSASSKVTSPGFCT